MNIQKLPNEMIYQIVSNMDSCSDILNFCITNSRNKDICKENALYLVQKAIERKYPKFQVANFISDLSRDFDKAIQKSAPFSYLNGQGVYQQELDAMPETRITRYNHYKWSDIRKSLLFISKAIKNNESINLTENDYTLPFMDSYQDYLKFNAQSMSIIRLLKRNFSQLQTINFDEFIDNFIRLNKDQWDPYYEKYNFLSDVCFTFNGQVDPDPDMDKQKYILTILCKILKMEKIDDKIKIDRRQVLTEFYGLGFDDTYREICNYLLEKIGLDRSILQKFVELQRTDLTKQAIIDKVFCEFNSINLNLKRRSNIETGLDVETGIDESEDEPEDESEDESEDEMNEFNN